LARRSGPVEVIAVDAETDRLYQAALEQFTPARNALAARLKAAGLADDAARVRALAKPGIPAWAVNQVYWRARDLFDRLLQSGDRLRRAQLAGLGGKSTDVAQAALARQQAIDAVVDRAMRFMTDERAAGSDAIRRRVAVTADALAAHGTLANRPPAGRLTGDLDPPGFAVLASLVSEGTGDSGPGTTGRRRPGAPAAPDTRRTPAAPETTRRGVGPGRGAERERRRDEARARRAAIDRARFEATRADGELRRRRSDQEHAARELERAAAALADAEAAAQAARDRLAVAEKTVAKARSAHASAGARADAAAKAHAAAGRQAAEARARLEDLR